MKKIIYIAMLMANALFADTISLYEVMTDKPYACQIIKNDDFEVKVRCYAQNNTATYTVKVSKHSSYFYEILESTMTSAKIEHVQSAVSTTFNECHYFSERYDEFGIQVKRTDTHYMSSHDCYESKQYVLRAILYDN